ncbi:MAG: hypothetical protein C5B48_06830 [Candidatus Rokuibacteriota bacterium]|nr:MAG: hypothetical protein C5B48_06830 [Candidatus Rokubacteria bacterium]
MDTRRVTRSLWPRRRFMAAAAVVLIVAGALAASRSYASTSSSDFELTVTPSSAKVAEGSSTRYTLAVTSRGGFAGTVHVGIVSVSPATTNGPTFHLSRYEIWVSPTAPTGTAVIAASTTSITPATTYTVTVRGKDITGGSNYGLTHSTSFTLSVQ